MEKEKESRFKYINDYKKANYKRVALELKKEDYEKLQAAAAAAGEPVNTYIKAAIVVRMEKESGE